MAKKETKLEKLREKPGMSNAGKYPNVKESNFCGPNGTYPVNTIKRARSALSLAHFSADPGDIIKCVHKKYPQLAADEKKEAKKKSPIAYDSSPFPLKAERNKKVQDTISTPKYTYKKGDLIDETDFESLNTKLNVQDVNPIQEDKKGQFITSVRGNESPYPNNPQRQDTIRPTKGTKFVSGWKTRHPEFRHNND